MPYIESKADEEATADSRINTDILRQESPALQCPSGLEKQTAVFQWSDVNYDIKVKKTTRKILCDVDGWIKPGRLTALMVCTSTQLDLVE